MILGTVNDQELPIIELAIDDELWPAVIDTAFTSYLELPEVFFHRLPHVLIGSRQFVLGGGQVSTEDVFIVDFPFDGDIVAADVTFVESREILVGAAMLRGYRLTVDYVTKEVRLERPSP